MAVEPQVFDLLVYLIQNRERVVSKDDLLDSVWHGRIVSESALGARINAARAAVGDNGEAQRVISTLPRKGLRFVGAVVEGQSTGTATGVVDRAQSAPSLPEQPSIVVLPFMDMSDDPERGALRRRRITEDLITGACAHPVAVRDRPQLGFRLQGAGGRREAGLPRARRSLRAGGQRAPLGPAEDAHQCSARRRHHRRPPMGRALRSRRSARSSPSRTRSPAASLRPSSRTCWPRRASEPATYRAADDLSAWELVARAQAHFWRMSRSDHEAAVTLLERAVETHPEYASARSLLGFRLVFAVHMGWVDRSQGLVLGHEHASRAIALDDRDPWGHIALGYWAMMERRTDESIAAFQRAVSSQSQLRSGTRLSWPHLWLFGPGWRGDRACGACHEAQSLGPGDGVLPRRYRGRSLYGWSICASRPVHNRSPAIAPRLSRSATAQVCEFGAGRPNRRSASLPCHGTPRPDAAVRRLDKSQRSLPNAAVDGTLPRGNAQSGAQ